MRRAINVIKDRIAAMDWQVRVRRGAMRRRIAALQARSCARLRRVLEEPNEVDSFRTLIEQVIEDALTGGFGAIEMEADRRSGAARDVVAGGRRFHPH